MVFGDWFCWDGRLCRAVLPGLRAGNGGYIVNISSVADIVGLPFSGLYCASKFALEGMSECLRLEMRPFGIHVVLVEPGDFRTQITAKCCVAEASQNSAYRTAFDKFKRKQDQDEAAEPTPEPVARLVERNLSHRRPKARYTVGMLGQRIVAPLKRLLPDGGETCVGRFAPQISFCNVSRRARLGYRIPAFEIGSPGQRTGASQAASQKARSMSDIANSRLKSGVKEKFR
jgi:short chain dehydrogenase